MRYYNYNGILDQLFEVAFRLIQGLVSLCIAAMVIAGIVSYALTGVKWLVELLAYFQ